MFWKKKKTMKNPIKIHCAILILICTGTAFTQQSDSTRKLQRSGVSVQIGSYASPGSKTNLDYFREQYPAIVPFLGSRALESWTFTNYGFAVTALANYQIKMKNSTSYNNRLSLQFGLSYGSFKDSYYTNESVFRRTDTLYSSNTSETVYVDSVYRNYTDISTINRDLSIVSGFIYSLPLSKRLSLYGGVNLSLGVNFTSKLDVVYGNSEGRIYLEYEEDPYRIRGSVYEDREILNIYTTDLGFIVSAIGKIGLDYRIDKKVNVFYELRPRFTGQAFLEKEGYSYFNMGDQNIGLAFRI